MDKIVALAGGVGGAKLVHGLSQCLTPEQLVTIVNIGDDFNHLGLRICPDLDTVCYTLAGKANLATGWGRAGETWNALESLGEIGGPTWFRLGDLDLGTHLERTRRLRSGEPLSKITKDFCCSWEVEFTVLPASDDNVPTWVYTEEGELPFQEYFVRRQCLPKVSGFRFADVEAAKPAPGVLEALGDARLVIICPSNPWVSIGPILEIPGIQEAVACRTVIAVSPIIGGEAVKGPAAKMYKELGIQPSAQAVAQQYGSLLTGYVIDLVDKGQEEALRHAGLEVLTVDTLMKTNADRHRLAKQVLDFGEQVFDRKNK